MTTYIARECTYCNGTGDFKYNVGSTPYRTDCDSCRGEGHIIDYDNPIEDLIERITKASTNLGCLADDTTDRDRGLHLRSKREGVDLVRSYVDELLRE